VHEASERLSVWRGLAPPRLLKQPCVSPKSAMQNMHAASQVHTANPHVETHSSSKGPTKRPTAQASLCSRLRTSLASSVSALRVDWLDFCRQSSTLRLMVSCNTAPPSQTRQVRVAVGVPLAGAAARPERSSRSLMVVSVRVSSEGSDTVSAPPTSC